MSYAGWQWLTVRYLQCFHQFIPILRRHDPDECFDICPTLLWVIVYVAARRYPRDGVIFSILVEHLSKDIWSMTSTTVLNLDNIHALLILCCWPLPTIRFMSDPSNMLASVAMNTAMLLGSHTGRGKNPQFLVGLRQNMQSTDEEASSTWLAACLMTSK